MSFISLPYYVRLCCKVWRKKGKNSEKCHSCFLFTVLKATVSKLKKKKHKKQEYENTPTDQPCKWSRESLWVVGWMVGTEGLSMRISTDLETETSLVPQQNIQKLTILDMIQKRISQLYLVAEAAGQPQPGPASSSCRHTEPLPLSLTTANKTLALINRAGKLKRSVQKGYNYTGLNL